MALRIKSKFDVAGMTCVQCEKIIQRSLGKHAGICESTVSYKTNVAEVIYDSELITLEEVRSLIEKNGYEATLKTDTQKIKTLTPLQISGIGLLLVALYLIISNTIGFNAIPEVQASMGYGMLFVVGLLTSIHCIAMCGGVSLSQCIKPQGNNESKDVYKSSFLYNGGRVMSYTIVGAIVGSVGSLISFSGASKGMISILAGLFMILMGINMLGIIPSLKKYNIQMPAVLRTLFLGKNGSRGPFVVGLLNGLMPCGPLQTMQLYALGTGSAVAGALSMFAFSLGTVPLMFGFGALSTLLSKNFTKNMMKVSAILVIVLGMVMFQRGTSLSGILLFDFQASALNAQAVSTSAPVVDGVQTLTLEVKSNGYPEFVIQKGIPTKINFHVTAENLNGCNNAILMPEFGIEKTLQVGDNWIEFTATKSGTFPYSCWMGMINSKAAVIE
jgi:sulfite exporter TauE/SafE/copper chaperone CopZ